MTRDDRAHPDHLVVVAAGHAPPPGASSYEQERALEASVVRLTEVAAPLLATGVVRCLSFYDTLLEELVARGSGNLLLPVLSRHFPAERLTGGTELRLLGDLSFLPPDFRGQRSHPPSFPCLVWLMNYTGTGEILRTSVSLARDLEAELTPREFQARLLTAGMPDPDLIIFTGGMTHLPNALLYQLAYCELHFCEASWSSFTADHLESALESFRKRKRRYGRV